jgi:hypothetical protein
MSVFDWLRQRSTPSAATAQGDSNTVRRIVSELDKLEPDRARYLAAFAYVLSRAAWADLHVTEEETAKMIAKNQNRLFGGTENFLVTREFRELASDAQRRDLLGCLFAVSAADEAITLDEESQIRQMASELGLSHADYIDVRSHYSDKRTVLRHHRK